MCCASEVTSHAAHRRPANYFLRRTLGPLVRPRRRDRGLAGVTSSAGTIRDIEGSSLDPTASLEQLTKANSCMVLCVRPTCTFMCLRDSESKDVCIHK